jgi:uncharacterized protein (DUF1015 family)
MSPYNVIRLEMGEELPQDSPGNNRYTRAAATLKRWLEEEILIRENRPALYVFQHRFWHQGTAKTCWGVTARLRLEDWSAGNVRPHEVTVKEHTTDRLNLLRSCQVNLSPIWGIIYPGEGKLLSLLSGLAAGEPDLTVTNAKETVYSMWIVTDAESIAAVAAFCADKILYIADGHHRYETALLYQKEQCSLTRCCSGEEAFNFVMITLMDAADPGLVMLPTHRLLRLTGGASPWRLKDQLSQFFEWKQLPVCGSSLQDIVGNWLDTLGKQGEKETIIGVYGLEERQFHLLIPREKKALQKIMPAERSLPWKELDVSLLHWAILRPLLGIDNPEKEKECLGYTQDGMEAVCRVDSGEYQIAFLLNPLPLSSVIAVADAGDRMPQKSTYFYPKLPAGMVMNPLW